MVPISDESAVTNTANASAGRSRPLGNAENSGLVSANTRYAFCTNVAGDGSSSQGSGYCARPCRRHDSHITSPHSVSTVHSPQANVPHSGHMIEARFSGCTAHRASSGRSLSWPLSSPVSSPVALSIEPGTSTCHGGWGMAAARRSKHPVAVQRKGRASGLTIAFVVFAVLAIAVVVRVTTRGEALSHRVVVGVQGCGPSCDEKLARALSSYLSAIGFDAVAPAGLANVDDTRAFARAHGARFGVGLVIAVEDSEAL